MKGICPESGLSVPEKTWIPYHKAVQRIWQYWLLKQFYRTIRSERGLKYQRGLSFSQLIGVGQGLSICYSSESSEYYPNGLLGAATPEIGYHPPVEIDFPSLQNANSIIFQGFSSPISLQLLAISAKL
jgi:hypothetical protein